MDSGLINILMILDLSSLTQSAMKYLSLAFLLSVSLVQLFPGSLPTVHQPQKVLENKSTALLSLGVPQVSVLGPFIIYRITTW